MPHFSESGHDMVLCQVCGGDFDTGKVKMEWRPDITKRQSAGNVCPSCVAKHKQQVELPKTQPRTDIHAKRYVSLHEYCHHESGGLTGAALQRYINRYYGHG